MNIYWLTKVDKHMLHKTSRIECAKSLRKLGHKVTLVSGQEEKKFKNSNNDHLFLPIVKNSFLSRISFNFSLLINLPNFVKKDNIDVILIDAGNVYIPFLLPVKMMGVKLVVDIRTLPLDNKKTIHSVLFNISMKLSKYIADGLTTITPELRTVLKNKYRLKDKNIGVWTSGVSVELFKPNKKYDNPELQKIFNDTKHFYLFYHGAYSPTRGIENLIGSLSEIKQQIRDNIRLIIIGFNERKQKEINDLCKKYNVEKNVVLLSPIDYTKIPSYIQKAHVGVIPLPPQNRWWIVSAPLKTMEYLAMAKPIIATDIPFHKRIFDKGSCGILLSNNDKKTLARSIETLYKNKNQLEKMGKTGRNIVELFYSWEKSGRDLEHSLKKIISSHE